MIFEYFEDDIVCFVDVSVIGYVKGQFDVVYGMMVVIDDLLVLDIVVWDDDLLMIECL